MPLIDVTYRGGLAEATLRQLGSMLPDVVAEAVACPEEPWVGPPQMGDVEIRFRERSPYDVGDLTCVIEIHSKLFASREANKHARADRIRSTIAEAAPNAAPLGVWLLLHEGGWAQ